MQHVKKEYKHYWICLNVEDDNRTLKSKYPSDFSWKSQANIFGLSWWNILCLSSNLQLGWWSSYLGFCSMVWLGIVIEYEDAMHEPGLWHHQAEVPGTQTTARWSCRPMSTYSFQWWRKTTWGESAQRASEQYLTKAAGAAGPQYEIK